jgi:hypothetical protein
MVLDANVLAPALVCDLLLRLAEEPRLYSPRWTAQILDEVRRVQVGKLGWPAHLAEYWREEVTSAFPEALVSGYESLIEGCTNHPGDRHVAAAGAHIRAAGIVTFNVRHFSSSALHPLGLEAIHPSDLLCGFLEQDPGAVMRRLSDIAGQRRITLNDLLGRLSAVLPVFARAVEASLRE